MVVDIRNMCRGGKVNREAGHTCICVVGITVVVLEQGIVPCDGTFFGEVLVFDFLKLDHLDDLTLL